MKFDRAAVFRFFRALWHAALYLASGRPVIVPREVMRSREEECRRCRFRDDIWCRKCHCLLGAKTKLASEECPDGRWKKLA